VSSNATLVQSYVRRLWWVSTALRESSALCQPPPPTYYETWAWPQDPETGKTVEAAPDGKRAFLCSGTLTAKLALRQHASVCAALAARCPECVVDSR